MIESSHLKEEITFLKQKLFKLREQFQIFESDLLPADYIQIRGV